ncbi:MAG: fasciclin domain-containing protein [Robiginitalea sp.]|nr:fasciclin domain-containing protein [Robiginitalea sp.]
MRALTRILLTGTALLSAVLNAQSSQKKDLEDLRIFREAVSLTELDELLENKGTFTVFAPTDNAFGKLRTQESENLMEPENRKQLRALVAYHIVAGELTASRILKALCQGKGSASFTTVLGEPLLATLDGTDIVLTDCLGNQARIIRADSEADNLVYHEIDPVGLPTPGP